MFKRLFGRPLVYGMAVATLPVMAAANCGQRDSVVQHLETKYSEQLHVGGLQKIRDSQAIMEIWASPETGTFTVLLTQPNGVSCIIAAGTDFFLSTLASAPVGTAS